MGRRRERLASIVYGVAIDELQELTWDIEPLVDGRGREGARSLLDDARERAEALAAKRGTVGSFNSEDLVAFMTEYGQVRELIGRAGSYANLSFSTDTQDPERGALLQEVEERATEISTMLLFFPLEWAEVPDEKADDLLAAPEIAFARHHLIVQRRYRPHLLSEPEERILAEKNVTGRSAWMRLFSDMTAAIEVELDGQKSTLEEALGRLSSHDREVRRTAAAAITKALDGDLRTRGFIFNMLVQDKSVDDRLRHYEHWLQSFNLSQEASDEAVQALVTAVKGRYDIAQRWYSFKAKVFGIDRLAYYDRSASVTDDDEDIGWSEAREVVQECYSGFSEVAGRHIRRFFDEGWIDVPPKLGKVGGAFCDPTVPSRNPFVLLNFTGKRRDVLTLAHELGHGLHQVLGNSQGPFHNETPLTVAETASVFGEQIVFNRLLETAASPASRFSLLASKVEGAIATVFRQVAMNQFEERVHNSRRSEGELSVDRLGDLWIETQREMLGDSVDLGDEYRRWWSYIPHFMHVPGYVYAYAFGQLLAMSVYALYEERGEAFVPSYLEMLSAGGSRSPEDLARIVGCDLTDPSFWDAGLRLVERDLDAAEAAALEAGVIP